MVKLTFGGKILVGTDFSSAYLRGEDFSETNLREANFSGAIIYWEDLKNIDLSKVSLVGVNLL